MEPYSAFDYVGVFPSLLRVVTGMKEIEHNSSAPDKRGGERVGGGECGRKQDNFQIFPLK